MAMNDKARERKIKIAVSSSASAVNMGLGIVKVLAGIYTNSLSIITDGVNNFGDVLSNAGAAVGFAVENKAPTEKFPAGFGRVEYIVTFIMAIIIMAVGGGTKNPVWMQIVADILRWTGYSIIPSSRFRGCSSGLSRRRLRSKSGLPLCSVCPM